MQVPRDGLVGKLQKLSQSQQSIESVSSFCVFYHKDARGVVAIWEEEFYKAATDRKMALLYLANHILQEGRRKGTGFQDEFFRVLPKAMQHLLAGSDDKAKRGVARLVAIWEERRVFGTRHIKSFQGMLGGGGGGGKAGGGGGGSGGGGGYQPARKASGGSGGAGGDAAATAAAARAAGAAAEKRKAFEEAWRPDLPISGDLAAVTTASGALEGYEAALGRELAARRTAIAALQAAVAAQEEGVAAAAAQLGAAGAQRQALQARMAQLSAGLVAGLAGIAGIAGLGGAAAPPMPPAAAAAAPEGSPEAPSMDLDLEEEDDDGAAALAGLEARRRRVCGRGGRPLRPRGPLLRGGARATRFSRSP
ncbi:MAG: RNA polymerase II-binding domain-containing protein [Monoraphidium minutum]|nr:MAG: RNA polymerase II-binding domain-containing protein [Monoraphidium minutum]